MERTTRQRRIAVVVAGLALMALPAQTAVAQEPPPSSVRVEVLRIARLTSQRRAIEVRTRVFCGPGDEIIFQNFLVQQSRGEAGRVGGTGIALGGGASCPTPPGGTITTATVFPRFAEQQFGLGPASVRTSLIAPGDESPVGDDILAEAEGDVLVIPDLGRRGGDS